MTVPITQAYHKPYYPPTHKPYFPGYGHYPRPVPYYPGPGQGYYPRPAPYFPPAPYYPPGYPGGQYPGYRLPYYDRWGRLHVPVPVPVPVPYRPYPPRW